MKQLLILILLTAALSCSREKPVVVFEETMFVMGTMVSITFAGLEEKKAQKLFHDLLTDFNYMQAAWNPWKPGSLARVNKLLASQEPFSIDPEIRKMILQASELSTQSDGYFNPAIGKLVKLWQFNQDEMPSGPPPSKDAIGELLASKPEMANLQINALNLINNNPAVILDLGAFAKGYGVDKAVDYLLSQGVENAIVNAGGDLRAIGKKGDKHWMIGIRDPRAAGILAGIEIHGDESVFTSGDYERYYEYQGKRYHHIINPKTGYPASTVRSVTVVHQSAAIADAAATALFVAGAKDWERIAKKMQLDQVMLIDSEGLIHLTPKIHARLQFEPGAEKNIRLSKAFQ